MAEFRIDRLKFRWKGNWTSGINYIKDDVVYYNGKAFVCSQGHISSSNFYEDENGLNTKTFTVTVGTDSLTGKNSGNYYIDGVESAELNLIKGKTYIFDQSDSTNANFNGFSAPLAFSVEEDGTLAGFSRFDSGIVYTINSTVVSFNDYVSQFDSAESRTIQVTLPVDIPDELFYFSVNKPKMGNVLNTKYSSFWELMFDGNKFDGVWTTNTFYSEGSIVIYGSAVYVANYAHTSANTLDSGLEANLSDWTLISSVDKWTFNWQANSKYIVNDLVKYGGIVYRCLESHISAANITLGLEEDQEKWEIVSYGIDYKGSWQKNSRYKEGDIVKQGSSLWRATTGHTSTPTIYNIRRPDGTLIIPTQGTDALAESISNLANGLPLSESNLQALLITNVNTGIPTTQEDGYGLSYADIDRNSIVESTDADEIFLYNTTGSASNGTLTAYIRDVLLTYLSQNNYTIETTGTFLEDISNWEIYVPGLRQDEIWSAESEYQVGDIVLYGGYSYIALQSNTNSVPSVNGKVQDTGDWELLIAGYNLKGNWSNSTQYKTGDIVRDNGYLYIAIDDNVAIYPDSDSNIWQKLVEGIQFRGRWQDGVEYFLGDVVTFIESAYVCIARHNSSASSGRPDLDIDQPDQDYWNILVKGAESNVLQEEGDLKVRGDVGVDERFAIGAKENALISTGNDPQWKSLTSIPRAFYVSPNGVDSMEYGKSDNAPFKTLKYACDYVRNNITGTLNTTEIGGQFVLQIALNTIFALGDTSNFPNLAAFLTSTNPETGRAYGDVNPSTVGITALDVSNIQEYFNGSLTIVSVKLAIDSILKYISYNCELFVGEFITVGAANFNVLNNIPPNTTIFVKTGYYQEILPISIPYNCAVVGEELRSTTISPANGYELSNMFYVRNGSGLRNMTLSGLEGTLGPQNEFLTRRPSAGAFVSLDPGTGPNDTSVWITTRSPYIQNVSTLGTACIGMKIDGALHNGGNRSIVANDFTQVLSDGIGYWADNVGRSELVSVFTYYCHIGYLATNGGILRATNGNNSYGTYGSVAEGFDSNEAPITGQIDNRTSEAQFAEAFTYGINEQSFLAIGYSHAGQEYSSASVTFNGSGINAAGYYNEFRNNAISQIRIIDPEDSSPAGGLNYTRIVNTLQTGSDGVIQLSQAETATAQDIIGQRLIITSGLGVGQYGEITAYNQSTKECIISRETDGKLGFDHFQPGWPIEPILDNTSVYSIEPRVRVEEPAFTSSIVPSPASNNWKYIAYGNARFVAVNEGGVSSNAVSTYSSTGNGWNPPILLGANTVISGVVFTGSKFLVAKESVSGSATNQILQSEDGGISWVNITLPTSAVWGSVASDGQGNVVLVATNGSQTVAYSADNGDSWSTSTIGGTNENWNISAYGNGKFVALANDPEGDVAYSTDNGATWTIINAALSPFNWTSITYGNGRFVAIAESSVDSTDGFTISAYSFDGITWYESTIDLGDFTNVSYGDGVFIATGTGNLVGKSADGRIWRTFGDDSTSFTTTVSGNWEQSVYNNGRWVVIQSGSGPWNTITTGARPIIRTRIESARITSFIIYDPGSNLVSNPLVEVLDNNFTLPVFYETFVNNGVLPQPEMSNRGQGYFTALATITGNGFAELYQIGTTLKLKNVIRVPGPGANLNITGNPVQYSISRVDEELGTGPYDLTVTIRPGLRIDESPEHEETISIRERYSQIRLTGHDFLDIGTGNFEDTRYPDLYLVGEDANNPRQPFNETVASGGGRVFYTSTDQDGNFRAGELFSVEQASGIVTIDATQFDLSGLTEISLGGIQIGGTNVIIREFSKEQTFIANSNNIVPTQRAIKAFVQSRITGGGSNATTNVLVAGQINIGTNRFDTTSGLQINVNTKVNMTGGIDGDFLASQYFASGGA